MSKSPLITQQVIEEGTSEFIVIKKLIENFNVSIAVIEIGEFYKFDNSNFSYILAFCTRYFIDVVMNI